MTTQLVVHHVCFILMHPVTGMVLVEKRLRPVPSAPVDYVGKLIFPGGKMEKGETPYQCLVREMREEIHCSPVEFEALAPMLQEWSGRTFQPYLVRRWVGNVPEATDAGDPLYWTAPETMLDSDIAPTADIARWVISLLGSTVATGDV